MAQSVFVARGITKVYRMGETEIHALEEGLKPGERVVVYPSDALEDGSRLEIRSPR